MRKTEKTLFLYESPTKWDSLFIRKYLKRKVPVWVIEPFHSYHHKKGIRFFPPHIPAYIEDLINHGKISDIRANDIQARSIYIQATDKAVEVVESVYPQYRKKHEGLFKYVSDTVKSPFAENVVIKDETIIGDHTFIDAGAVIGCEGILYIEGGRI